MRHVFIVNPAAGKKRGALELLHRIHAAFAGAEEGAYAIRVTRGAGDATAIAREECAGEGPVRLYACGGDGTLTETATGAAGCPRAQIAAVPCGSANDYVRSYGGTAAFLDIPAQVHGRAVPVDAVDCGDRVSMNSASMGMDAAVAQKMVRYKNLPLVSGPMSYNLAIADVFCHRIGVDLHVVMDTPDGPVERRGRYFFALAACARFYGGGYCGAPGALVDDGLLDFVLVKVMPRLKIPGFLSRYKAGRHMDMACCEAFRGTRMRVSSLSPVVCNIDGECFSAPDIHFQALPGALSFVLPEGVRLPGRAPAVSASL